MAPGDAVGQSSWAAICGVMLLVLPHVHGYWIMEEILTVPFFGFTVQHYNAHTEHVRQRQILTQILQPQTTGKIE